MAVHRNFKLKPETLHLAVNLVDRYGYKRFIQSQKYYLLGATCLFMAAKYQEMRTPNLAKYMKECDGVYRKEEFLEQEANILDSINFHINEIVLCYELM